MADFNFAPNQMTVDCYVEDNQSWNLNAMRTRLKYTVEGESLGAKKITKTKTDGDTFISYTTSEGTLYLDNQKEVTFQFKGNKESQKISCKVRSIDSVKTNKD